MLKKTEVWLLQAKSPDIQIIMKRLLTLLTAILLPVTFCLAQTEDVVSVPKINKKNLIVKEWNAGGKGNAQTLDHVTIYSAEGKKIEETEYDTSGRQKWRKRYEWGENGKMTRELVYNERNKLVNYKKFEYNEFGKKKVQYMYDPKGKLISTKKYEYITEDA